MEELKPELETEVNIQTVTSEKPTVEEPTLDNLPRLEDMIKSEKEVKAAPQIEGVTQVQASRTILDKPFERKEDKKKALLKKRQKIVAGVGVSVATLLLAFVGINAVTLAVLSGTETSNAETIQSQNEVIADLANTTNPSAPLGEITIALNEPRDYSDDKKELTILDKLTIMFRSIFG